MFERLKSHCWWLISGANQSLCVNHANFNLSHRINIQGEGHRGWEADLQKCDYPIQGWAVNCKITQFPTPLGC